MELSKTPIRREKEEKQKTFLNVHYISLMIRIIREILSPTPIVQILELDTGYVKIN